MTQLSHSTGKSPEATIAQIASDIGPAWEEAVRTRATELLEQITARFPDRVITHIDCAFWHRRVVIAYYTRDLVGEQEAWVEI